MIQVLQAGTLVYQPQGWHCCNIFDQHCKRQSARIHQKTSKGLNGCEEGNNHG